MKTPIKPILFAATSFAVLIAVTMVFTVGVSSWALICEPYGLDLPLIEGAPLQQAGQPYCERLPG